MSDPVDQLNQVEPLAASRPLLRRAGVAWTVAFAILIGAVWVVSSTATERGRLASDLSDARERLEQTRQDLAVVRTEVQALRDQATSLEEERASAQAVAEQCLGAVQMAVELFNSLVEELNALGSIDLQQAEDFRHRTEQARDIASQAVQQCEQLAA